MAAAEPLLRRSWSSDLPIELLSEIFQKLTDCEDISQCAAVCLSWRSLIRTLYRQLTSLQSPFLLLSSPSSSSSSPASSSALASASASASSNNDKKQCCSCTLFSTQTKNLHQIYLPQLKERWCSSSSDGWLLTIPFDRKKNPSLLNPFTRDQIRIPYLGTFCNPQDLRVVTSTSPLDPKCVVLAIDGTNLYVCRPGDKTWTPVMMIHRCNYGGFNWGDTICYKGEFYADLAGQIFHLKFSSSGSVEAVSLPVSSTGPYGNNYFVELKGELLLVRVSQRYDVYRLDWHRKRWIEVRNIGPNAIFLGKHSSTSLCVSKFRGDFEENCIYFVTHNRDVVVHHLGTNNYKTLYHSSLFCKIPPNWLRVESAEFMGSKDEQIDYVAPWPIIEEHFVKLLHKVAKNGLLALTWEEMAWTSIEDNMFEEFGKRYTVSKLKSKYDHLCRLHHEFSKLLAHTGMAWDPKTNIVRAHEDVWESYIKKNPLAKQFQNKGCEYYHLLDETIAYIQSSQSHNTKIELKIRGVLDAANMYFDIEGGKQSIVKNKRHCSLNDLNNLCPSKKSKTPQISGNENERSPVFLEHASIEECIQILESMNDLDDDVYVKACEKFTSIDWRRMFVAMSNGRKRKWLHTLK